MTESSVYDTERLLPKGDVSDKSMFPRAEPIMEPIGSYMLLWHDQYKIVEDGNLTDLPTAEDDDEDGRKSLEKQYRE